MTKRSTRTVAHAHRLHVESKGKDMMLRKHRFLRRATGFMLARKYRYMTHHSVGTGGRGWEKMPASMSVNGMQQSITGGQNASGQGNESIRGYSRDELLNFWNDLPEVAKRALLRIHRDVYLNALDDFLIQQNLCCECHDNVIAEWEDHERRRGGSRSLREIFTVLPPVSDDEDDEDDVDDEDEDEDDGCDEEDEYFDEMCAQEAAAMDERALADEELLLSQLDSQLARRYALDQHITSSRQDTLPSLEQGINADSRQIDSQHSAMMDALAADARRLSCSKEERYVIIREDHTDFIMDLIRCGEQYSQLMSSATTTTRMDDDGSDGEDDDGECPGANTSHLAQEYLLEVLAIKFREQLEIAYQAALQHSLAVQAELLRDEIADLQASRRSSNKKRKNKEKKKRKKKDDKSKDTPQSQAPSNKVKSIQSDSSGHSGPDTGKQTRRATTSSSEASINPSKSSIVKVVHDSNHECESPTPDEDALDQEVEAFRLLLEKIQAENGRRERQKLVLPPGALASLTAK